MPDLTRLRAADNARRQLYDQCDEALQQNNLADEIRREIKDIRERTGSMNPVIEGPSRVLKQVTFDWERLEQILIESV